MVTYVCNASVYTISLEIEPRQGIWSCVVKAMINSVEEPFQINKIYTIKGTLFI